MDEQKTVRRRFKRPDAADWFASKACASADVVEPLSMRENRLNRRWMKRQRRFHQEALSSPVADLPLPHTGAIQPPLSQPPPHTVAIQPPLSQTVAIQPLPHTVAIQPPLSLPPPHTVAIQPPLSQTVVDLPPPSDKVAELPLVTPPASTSKKSEELPSSREAKVPYEFAESVLRSYWEFKDSRDKYISNLRELDEREELLREAIVSKGKVAATQGKGSALVDSAGEIFELAQLIRRRDVLLSKECYDDSQKHALLDILRKQPVIPISSEADVILVKQLKDDYHWNGKVCLSDNSHELLDVEEMGTRIQQAGQETNLS